MEVMKGSMKGQLMTLTLLILFILMLAILLFYVNITVNYNSIAQSVALTKSSISYGQLLTPGLATFMKASAEEAMWTLATYEASPSARGSNFISNFSAALSSMMTNGTLSGAAQGTPGGNYIADNMQDLILKDYNSALLGAINSSYNIVSVNQTNLSVRQLSPYSLTVSLVDNVRINATGNTYNYHLPVNVTVPINGTIDMYYARDGLIRYINFVAPDKASAIGGTASFGNATGYVYGSFYQLPNDVTSCPKLASTMPSSLQSSPINKSIILVMINPTPLIAGGCANKFGGIVSNTLTLSPRAPGVPYLIYPPGTPLTQFQTGQHALLYGPLLELLNISGFQSQAMNGDFFASGYASSYLDRSVGSLASASPYGLFSLLGYDYQNAVFNGASSVVTGPAVASKQSVSIWIKTGSPTQQVFFDAGSCNAGQGGAYQLILTQAGGIPGNPPVEVPGLYISFWNDDVYIPVNLADNRWHNVVVSWDGGTGIYVSIDGSLPEGYTGPAGSWSSLSPQPFTLFKTPHPAKTPILIGGGRCNGDMGEGSQFFSGTISDVQLYNSALTVNQMYSEYSGGVFGVPAAPANIIGWWPLNGNANDYSGNGNNGVATSVTYTLLQNYSRDSVFGTPLTSNAAAPIPGILSCTSSAFCAGNTMANLFFGRFPAVAGGPTLVPVFSANSYVITSNTPSTSVFTMSSGSLFGWVNTTSIGSEFVYSQNGNSLMSIGTGSGGTFVTSLESSSGSALSGFSSGITIDDNAWRQVGVTWGSGVATLYVNGAAVASNTFSGTIDLHHSSIDIGGICCWSNTLVGSLDDIQLYNQTLTPTQAGMLYDQGPSGMPIGAANVVGWWPLDGTFNDYGGFGLNATYVNTSFAPLRGSGFMQGLSGIRQAQTEGQLFGFT